MGVTVLGGAWGGTLLDKYFHFTIPIFTLVLSVSSVALAMYIALRDLGSFDKKNKNP
jgi:F0F1-type ATP synthase assembly protein I